jgi:hypothetical protein
VGLWQATRKQHTLAKPAAGSREAVGGGSAKVAMVDMSVEMVVQWLRTVVGASAAVCDDFEEQQIDGDALPDLDGDTLGEFCDCSASERNSILVRAAAATRPVSLSQPLV